MGKLLDLSHLAVQYGTTPPHNYEITFSRTIRGLSKEEFTDDLDDLGSKVLLDWAVTQHEQERFELYLHR